MCPLPRTARHHLLEVARRALVTAVRTGSVVSAGDSPADSSSAIGAFVTLHLRGRLRGCVGQIGFLQPVDPLIARCAGAAALDDPRFRPVQPQEIAEIEIELSILSALETISPELIEVGKHGLMVTRGAARGVLLPQVATQYRWTALRFLEETCAKAGFERGAWSAPGTRVEAFTAEVFSESQLYAGASERP